jgi:hypothetical protein
MAQRFVSQYGLSDYDATALTQSRSIATYFEATAQACGQPKLAGNWITGELARRLNAADLSIEQASVSAAQLGALISVMEGWGYAPERFSEEGRKEVVVSEPAEKRAKDALPAINRRVEQQPNPQPAIPVEPPTNRATNLPNQKPPPPPQIPKRPPPPPNVKAILPIIVASLDHLTACIDTSTTSVVFDAVSCLADAVRGAVASINGADLSVQAHWDHAVWLAGMLAETAHDLGHWAVPLSRPLAETLFAVRRGVMFTDREMGCEGGARSAVVVSMLGRVGRGLYGLMDGREGFYGYMGREAEAEMVGMVEMLVALAVV